MCLRKLSLLVPSQPVTPLEWPPVDWDSKFRAMIKKYSEVLVYEVTPGEGTNKT